MRKQGDNIHQKHLNISFPKRIRKNSRTSWFLYLSIIILCLWVNCLCEHVWGVCVYQVYNVNTEDRKGVRAPGIGVTHR